MFSLLCKPFAPFSYLGRHGSLRGPSISCTNPSDKDFSFVQLYSICVVKKVFVERALKNMARHQPNRENYSSQPSKASVTLRANDHEKCSPSDPSDRVLNGFFHKDSRVNWRC